MKKTTLFTLALMLLASTTFATPYYVYTAVKNGWWNDRSVWNVTLRKDGVQRTRILIPASFTVSIDNSLGQFDNGDVDLSIAGVLRLAPNTTIQFSAKSVIILQASGSVLGTQNTEKIVLGGVVKYDGSVDRQKTGVAVASATTGMSPNGFSAPANNPMSLIKFNVIKESDAVQLRWTTSSESHVESFDIQRSHDNVNWTAIESIPAAGDSKEATTYSFIDRERSKGATYYRIKQMGTFGEYTYSVAKTYDNKLPVVTEPLSPSLMAVAQGTTK